MKILYNNNMRLCKVKLLKDLYSGKTFDDYYNSRTGLKFIIVNELNFKAFQRQRYVRN